MKKDKNISVPGYNGRLMAVDVFARPGGDLMPVVIYAHGFNGFKDWGDFDTLAERMAAGGCVFVKFNFSHNGTTPAEPTSFTDLEAFAENNYTKQLFDLRCIIDWVCNAGRSLYQEIDPSRIYLVGHSMGGGMVILQAAEDDRIKKVVGWAAIDECKTPWGSWPEERIKEWQQAGVQYYTNTRTGQEMPMYYQLYEDYLQHSKRLDICKAIGDLQIPVLLCHGSLDTAVPVERVQRLKGCQPAANVFIVESDHVFGRKHLGKGNELPPAMDAVLERTARFLFGDPPVATDLT